MEDNSAGTDARAAPDDGAGSPCWAPVWKSVVEALSFGIAVLDRA